MDKKAVWLSGNLHERKATLEKIKSSFSSINTYYFDDSNSFAEFESCLNNNDCFAENKLIIVSGFPSSTFTKPTLQNHIKKLITDLSDGYILLFNNIEGEGSTPIRNFIEKQPHGKVISYISILTPQENPVSWVMNEFTKYGKSIESDNAQFFIDLNGFDKNAKGISIDILYIAIQKICHYVGKRKIVDKNDIIVNGFKSQDFVIWSIFDAFDSKNPITCYNIIHEYIENENDLYSAVYSLFNICLWRYKLLVYMKEQIAKGVSKYNLAEHIDLIKLKDNFNGLHTTCSVGEDGPKTLYASFTINKELNSNFGKTPSIDLYSRKELINLIQCIYNNMEELRWRGSNNGLIMILIDVLIYHICSLNSEKIKDIALLKKD